MKDNIKLKSMLKAARGMQSNSLNPSAIPGRQPTVAMAQMPAQANQGMYRQQQPTAVTYMAQRAPPGARVVYYQPQMGQQGQQPVMMAQAPYVQQRVVYIPQQPGQRMLAAAGQNYGYVQYAQAPQQPQMVMNPLMR